MKLGTVVLARMGASRLPGKVLKEVCGKPMLEHILIRLSKVNGVVMTAVASTVNPKDDAIETLCKRMAVPVFRGSEDNVLDRSIKSAEAFGLDAVIRIGADSAFIDWEIINELVKVWNAEYVKGNKLEYLSNNLNRSYPLGLDAEIFLTETFRRIDRETRDLPRAERELNEINVVPYMHQNLDKFRHYSYRKDFDYSHHRWTLDTPEDWDLITKVYEALYPAKPDFLMNDILALLEKHPDWPAINSKVKPKSGYWTEAEKQKLEKKLSGI